MQNSRAIAAIMSVTTMAVMISSAVTQPAFSMTWPYEVQVSISGETTPVTFSLWLPSATPTIKGLIISHTHGDGGVFAENQSVLTMAQEAGLGIIKFYASSMKSFKVSAGNDKSITSALDALAKKSAHPEVATVPLCPFGHSSACKFSAGMANLWSDRVFAYIAWKPAGTVNMLNAAVLTPTFIAVPGLYLSGTLEGVDLGNPPGVNYASIEARVEEFRAKHALVQHAVEQGARHTGVGKRAPGYVALFIKNCAKARLYPAITTVAESSGWLGNYTTHAIKPFADYGSGSAKASWLLNEEVARAWQAFVSAGTVVQTPRSSMVAPQARSFSILGLGSGDVAGGFLLNGRARYGGTMGLPTSVIRVSRSRS